MRRARFIMLAALGALSIAHLPVLSWAVDPGHAAGIVVAADLHVLSPYWARE